MPVYKDETKKKNPYWYEFYTDEKDPKTNRRGRIRKKGFSSEKEAEKAMIEAKYDYNKGKYIAPIKTTVGDFLMKEWLPIKKIGDQTKITYEMYMRNHIVNFQIGKKELSQVTPSEIQNLIINLEEKGLAPNTIKRIFTIFSTAMNDAVKLKKIKENPCNSIINKPIDVFTEKTIWTEEEIRKFVKESAGRSRYSLVFRFTLMTGLRQGEVLGLRWKDIDFNRNIVRIAQTLTHSGKNLKIGAKNKSSMRAIKIDNKTKLELVKQHNLIQQEKQKLGEKYQDNNLVFCTNKGTPCSPRNLMRAFYGLLETIDVPKITFHELRHTQATVLLERGMSTKVVSGRLGHKSTRITEDTYMHVTSKLEDMVVECLEGILP